MERYDVLPVKNAIVSVYNKENIEQIGRFLVNNGVTIYSTGNTAKFLEQKGIDVKLISEITKFPEILDGRVKTLHPVIHGGILARRDNKEDMKTVEKLNIPLFDLVIVDFYPFEEKFRYGNILEEIEEFIDIGGPTMIRAAAKNYKFVSCIINLDDFSFIKNDLKVYHGIRYITRLYLAKKIFNFTSYYDSLVFSYLNKKFSKELEQYKFYENIEKEINTKYLTIPFKLSTTLRYGENPHQSGSLYLRSDKVSIFNNLEQLNGKKISYNNIKDIDVAWQVVSEFAKNRNFGALTACCAVKHNTPCGVGLGETSLKAFNKAFMGDNISIFGGIIAINNIIDEETAKVLSKIFLEIIVAKDFTDKALSVLKKKKNLRLIKITDDILNIDKKQFKGNEIFYNSLNFDISSVNNGVLIQNSDMELLKYMKEVTEIYSEVELKNYNNKSEIVENKEINNRSEERVKLELLFAYIVSKYAKSNAIVVSSNFMTLGIGSGQQNRINAAKLAFENSKRVLEDFGLYKKPQYKKIYLASDGFFPFDDVVKLAAKNNVYAIIQPGGSIRDKDSIKAANDSGIRMFFTGMRHFRH